MKPVHGISIGSTLLPGCSIPPSAATPPPKPCCTSPQVGKGLSGVSAAVGAMLSNISLPASQPMVKINPYIQVTVLVTAFKNIIRAQYSDSFLPNYSLWQL